MGFSEGRGEGLVTVLLLAVDACGCFGETVNGSPGQETVATVAAGRFPRPFLDKLAVSYLVCTTILHGSSVYTVGIHRLSPH